MQRSSPQVILIASLWAVVGQPITAQSLLLRPEYSTGSIANAAGIRPGRLAPNTIFTIYGTNLSNIKWAIRPEDLLNNRLPTSTPNGEVFVQLQGIRLPLFFVSPNQINALVPADFLAGNLTLQVYRDITRGPATTITISAEAPEIFRLDTEFAAATHADGRVITAELPAVADEVIVIYGTGFGPLKSNGANLTVPDRAIEVRRAADYRVRIDGEELTPVSVQYVGITPGFAGLYQVNVRMPKQLDLNVRFEVGVDGSWSDPGIRLYTRKTVTN